MSQTEKSPPSSSPKPPKGEASVNNQDASPQAEGAATQAPPASLAARQRMAKAGQAMKGRLRLAPVQSGGGNMVMVKSFFLGAVVTAFFYEIFPLPFMDEQGMARLFDNWVSETILGLSLWSLFLLGFKYRVHRFELAAQRAFFSVPVKAVFATGVYAREVDGVMARLADSLKEQEEDDLSGSIIHRRVARMMNYIRSAPKKEGLNDLLDYQAQIDLKKLEASYAVLTVFIWAIPILGFIGTVLGIADAVGEFSNFIQTAESGAQFNTQMRTALGGVTSGLAVAFNTTFLALMLVIPVMMAASLLQKNEEELLLSVEEYCLEELLPHLHIRPSHAGVGENFDQHLVRVMQLSDAWLGQLGPLVEKMSLKAEMLEHQIGGVQPLIKDFTDVLLASEGLEAAETAAPTGKTGAKPASSKAASAKKAAAKKPVAKKGAAKKDAGAKTASVKG